MKFRYENIFISFMLAFFKVMSCGSKNNGDKKKKNLLENQNIIIAKNPISEKEWKIPGFGCYLH